MKMKYKKITTIISVIMIMAMIFTLTSCQKNDSENKSTDGVKEKTIIKVAALKGPTGIGMVKLMDDNENNKTANKYQFSIAGSPDEIVGKITTGEVDVAAVPTNLAAALYNKTNGKVKIAALNTLGVLYILEKGDQIKSTGDLKGKTIYATGKGSTPEYILNYILKENGLNPETDVNIEYKSEHAELSALAVSGKADIVMLPEPFVTTTLMKNNNLRIALDLTKEWENIDENDEKETGVLSMGALIVRDEFLSKNKAAFDAFMDEYQASTEFVKTNVDDSANLVAKFEILASEEAAKKAIPNCNIVFIKDGDMKQQIKPFYNMLFEADPKSVGGKIPDDSFYYEK